MRSDTMQVRALRRRLHALRKHCICCQIQHGSPTARVTLVGIPEKPGNHDYWQANALIKRVDDLLRDLKAYKGTDRIQFSA